MSRLAPVLVFALPLTLLGSGCDCSGPTRGGVCNVPSPPAECGMTCAGGPGTCPAGFYCEGGSCTADCSAEVACAAGYVCSAGMCLMAPDTSPGGDLGPPRDVMGTDNTCASVDLDANRVTPNVLVIIDRSGSMGMEEFPPGSGTSRWDALRDALLAMPDGLFFSLQSSVRFGIVTYQGSTGGGGGTCPNLEDIPCRINNFPAIRTSYTAMSPGGATPTGEAIDDILGMLPALVPTADPGDPTIFILATDGEPNTCADRMDTTTGRMNSVNAVTDAYAMGIPTYVISVGTDTGADHLQDVANAGAGVGPGDPDATYWVASDTAGLNDALSTIVGGVVSCRLELSGMIDPAMACLGEVRLGGTLVPCDDPNGWHAIDASTIELTGTACDELQSSGSTLTARFPCDVVIF